MKTRKTIKKIIKFMFIFIIFGIVYSFFFTTYENIKVTKDINNFKDRAITYSKETNVLPEERLITYNSTIYLRKYWVVPRETSAELNDNKNVFIDSDKENIGQIGDIFVTRQSPFPKIIGFHQFMSYYFGGHAALKSDTSTYLEATGFPEDFKEFVDTVVSDGLLGHDLTTYASATNHNYWIKPNSKDYYYDMFYRSRYIGLRIANNYDDQLMYEDLINGAISNAEEKIENEALYNFIFFLNMKRKYYCTDFVSRVFEEAFENVDGNNEYKSKGYAKRLNDDGFITSVNDLILSKDTYISFYVEINEEKIDGNKVIVENIYYLEDIE